MNQEAKHEGKRKEFWEEEREMMGTKKMKKNSCKANINEGRIWREKNQRGRKQSSGRKKKEMKCTEGSIKKKSRIEGN